MGNSSVYVPGRIIMFDNNHRDFVFEMAFQWFFPGNRPPVKPVNNDNRGGRLLEESSRWKE
jgi:hypothetical protein